jgi:hypothetical protein
MTKEGLSQNRKARKRRVSESSVIGDIPFRPIDSDWKGVEQAYSQPLKAEDRAAIAAMVKTYFYWAPFETNAPFVSDVENRVKVLRTAASAFERAFVRRGRPEEAIIYAESLLARKLSPADASRQMHSFRQSLSNFIRACDQALKELHQTDYPSFEEGDAWRKLVRGLTSYLRSQGYPTGASQAFRKDGRDSEFVCLFEALQKLFPSELRRHHLSGRPSLAKEINRARNRRWDTKPARESANMSHGTAKRAQGSK